MNEHGTIPDGYTANYAYSSYCANRLPCGLCRLMMSVCPLSSGVSFEPTWQTQTGPFTHTQASSDPNSKITAWNSEEQT